jgi:drug/metabolite transporter (DMT)-like permease
MSPKLMIGISVALSGLAQIFLKHGLSQMQRSTIRRPGVVGTVFGVASQGFIWLWGMSFVAATGLWLLGLQRLDLSYAYPLISFGYVLVSVLSLFFFGERVDANRWLAIAVISLGVVLIAGS